MLICRHLVSILHLTSPAYFSTVLKISFVIQEGAAVKVLVAANEKHLAVATSSGHVSIAALTGGVPTTVLNNSLHKGAVVTSLVWAEDGSKLLTADSKGLVSCSRVAVRIFRDSHLKCIIFYIQYH